MTNVHDSQVKNYLARLKKVEDSSSPIYTPGAAVMREWYESHNALPAAAEVLSRSALGTAPIEIFLRPDSEAFAVYLRDHHMTGANLYTSKNVRVRYSPELVRFYPGGLLNRPRLHLWSSPVRGVPSPFEPHMDAIDLPWLAVFTVAHGDTRKVTDSALILTPNIDEIVKGQISLISGRS